MGGIHAGKWRGIYNHKNVLGKLMAISTPIFLLLALDAKKNQLFLWLGCSFSLLLLLLSSATSSMINCVVILSLVPICQLLRLNYERMIPALTGILAIGLSLYTWVTSNAEALLGSLGKDTTLTGRGDLWPLVLNVIWKRPWLGYGYGGFWYGWDSEASALWYAATWTPPNSHNGFLDIWLQLGFVGLFLLAMIFTTSFIKALVCILFTKASITIWPLLYMTYMIMANLGETTLMVQNDIFWVIYVAVYYSLLFYSQDFTKMDKA
jgi:O-antigen ligase